MSSRKLASASVVFEAFRQNESILRRFLRRFTSNAYDVEDICQETILRALEAEKSREIREPRAFLFGVTRNIVRKRLDRESRSVIDFIEDFAPPGYLPDEPSVEESVDGRERMLAFAEAVATLPGQCQRVFVLKKVYGYSHKEIAQALGISISTVEKHVAAGLKRASDHMQRGAAAGVSDIRADESRDGLVRAKQDARADESRDGQAAPVTGTGRI